MNLLLHYTSPIKGKKGIKGIKGIKGKMKTNKNKIRNISVVDTFVFYFQNFIAIYALAHN
jgi:hypothetical protein